MGTAGHVDHGKTALVRALTGKDTDRLPEERARGISIDIGFAELGLPGGAVAHVVDVPGHERFIRNMVAGATGVDVVLLVVAADEGVMPQTREHLAVMDLLGVTRGIVVLTKADLVDAEWLELVRGEVEEEVAGTFLAGAPVLAVSSVTGQGLDELRAAIARVAASLAPRPAEGPARLPVDRAFTVPGFGTVVTGTLWSGTVAPGDRLELLPGGREVRVRGVQVMGKPVERASAGSRVALNLGGLEVAGVRRGNVLATPGTVPVTDLVALSFRLLPLATGPLPTGRRVKVHTGTAEVIGRLTLLDRDELWPGEEAPAQVRLEELLPVLPGDRCVVRSLSPVTTVGGGPVVAVGRRFRRRPEDVEEFRRLAAGGSREVVAAALAEGVAVDARALALRTGLAEGAAAAEAERLAARGLVVRLGPFYLAAPAVEEIGTRLAEWLGQWHRRHPLLHGAPREEVVRVLGRGWDQARAAFLLEELARRGYLELRERLVALPGYEVRPAGELARVVACVDEAWRRAGVSPPAPEALVARALHELPATTVSGSAAGGTGGVEEASPEASLPPAEEVVAYLVAEGRLVRVAEDVYLHRHVLDEVIARVRRHLEEKGSTTMAELRDLLGTTRRYAVPIGEYLDSIRLTRREGDARRLYGR